MVRYNFSVLHTFEITHHERTKYILTAHAECSEQGEECIEAYERTT